MVSASKKRVTNLMQEVLRQTMDLACEIVEKKGRRIVVMEVCGTPYYGFCAQRADPLFCQGFRATQRSGLPGLCHSSAGY